MSYLLGIMHGINNVKLENIIFMCTYCMQSHCACEFCEEW